MGTLASRLLLRFLAWLHCDLASSAWSQTAVHSRRLSDHFHHSDINRTVHRPAQSESKLGLHHSDRPERHRRYNVRDSLPPQIASHLRELCNSSMPLLSHSISDAPVALLKNWERSLFPGSMVEDLDHHSHPALCSECATFARSGSLQRGSELCTDEVVIQRINSEIPDLPMHSRSRASGAGGCAAEQ